MCLNIKLYDSTSHCEKTEINRGVLTTPALTGTNCMIEQPNLAIEAGPTYVQYKQPKTAKQGICSLQTTKHRRS